MSHREPIFNVPGVVLCLLAVFFVVHLALWILPEEQSGWWIDMLAFVPARASGQADYLPGGHWVALTSFITHQFVHGDLAHLLINSAWLLAFGTPVARRTDWVRFLAFFLVCGVAGALLYLAVNYELPIRVVGASGAISGLMGAAFRFIFRSMEQGGALGLANSRATPLMSLAETITDRRILLVVACWTVLNVVLGRWGTFGLTEAAGIAWEAHLGGFYAGLLLYGWFDRPPALEDDVALAE